MLRVSQLREKEELHNTQRFHVPGREIPHPPSPGWVGWFGVGFGVGSVEGSGSGWLRGRGVGCMFTG